MTKDQQTFITRIIGGFHKFNVFQLTLEHLKWVPSREFYSSFYPVFVIVFPQTGFYHIQWAE